LILVDTSVWIDFFRASPGGAGQELKRLIEESEPLALSGIIVTEVLQGLTRNVEQIEYYLSLWDLIEPQGFDTYRRAAALNRLARSCGMTLTTVDALIATVALENGAALFSLDEDFPRLARLTGLRMHTWP
jgi:hypothetical protein